ncbi:peptidase, S41 family [Verrucomicrobiia bacterium DG1235]|nr:peptidase, S41 family [Verrucomicrobiae bacterium DG1235]
MNLRSLKSHALLCCLLLLAAATPAKAEKELTAELKTKLVEAIGHRLERKAYAFETDFSRWRQLAAERSTEIEAAKTEDELARVLGEALDEFGLSHLGIFSPSTVKLQRVGQRAGVGITIHPLDSGGGLISYVLDNSPAERCGLQKGDILHTIDESPLDDIKQLAGDRGQKRTISWMREDQKMSCEIEYDVFSLSEPSRMYWLQEDVAVIQIQSFQYRYYRAAKINRFFKEAKNAKAIILDLRNNRGGLSFYSRHLASKISPSSETFALLAQKKHERTAKGHRPQHPLPLSKPYRGKVVVLVDSLSASAADIIPAFVSETGRGLVIGQRTSGALQLARSYPLPAGFRIYLPIAELLTPKGNRLEGTGFKPDVELSLEETINDEIILQAALAAIEAN